MVKNMTAGRPISLIFQFFIPLLLGNLFQQFYSMVDSIIVGKFVGVTALAAVGATGALNFLILGFATGICSGFGIMAGYSFGAKDYRAMRNYIANSFYITAGVALILTPATMLLCRKILVWMQTPEELLNDACSYLLVILAGILVTMIYNVASAILRAIGDSRTPLFALIGASLLNIILDLVFIRVFHMGTFGAGVATVIAQGVSAVVCLSYMFRKYEILQILPEEFHVDFGKIKRLLGIGIPMALQFSITAIGSIIIQCAVNGLGAISVAAMTAGSKINLLFNGALEMVGMALATYCSQNMGARQYGRVRTGIWSGFFLSIGVCACTITIVQLFGRQIALLFINPSEKEIMQQIIEFVRINSLFYPALGLLFVLRNSLQGMGYSFIAMLAGVSELIARSIVAFGLVGTMGFLGVTLANPAAWVMASVILVISYLYIAKKLDFKAWKHAEKENKKGRPSIVALLYAKKS